MPHPGGFSWSDVEPARSAVIDVEAAVALALPHVPPAPLPDRKAARAIEDAIDAAFIRRFGTWAAGWRWAGGEGSIGGGPVRGWCCESHSIWPKGDRDARATAQRAAAGLVSWRDWIVELAALFERKSDPSLPAVAAFERHAAAVFAAVVERTGAEDAWYAHATQVLRWFLESQGHNPAIAGRATKGRFESWVTPTEEVSADIVADLRDGVFRGRRDHVDGIALWKKTRAATAWNAPLPETTSTRDSMLDHIVNHDAAIDDARGAAMLAALEAERIDARGAEPLSFALLARWQSNILADASLRRHDAWAKDGRERYEHHPDLGERVEAWLRDANDASVPVVARAARVYLDVCFLHPFTDGNARAARLALDFVLTRVGLTIDDADGALFRMPLAVTDPKVGEHYQTLLAKLVRRRG